jgi:hypothetical protein
MDQLEKSGDKRKMDVLIAGGEGNRQEKSRDARCKIK